MRFVASADWQLGKLAGFLPAEARARYTQARNDVLRRMGDLARQVGADFLVVGGDVFESNQVDRSVIGRSLESMRMAGLPIYLLPGNHDPLGPGSIYDSPQFTSACPKNVVVLRDSGVAATLTASDGSTVQLLAAPWHSKDPRRDLLGEMLGQFASTTEGREEGVVRIAVGHGNVSTLQADRESRNTIDVEQVVSHLQDGLIDFVVVGDRHGTYEIAPSFWYPGTPEVTAEREVDPGNALVVEIDPGTGQATVEKHRVGEWTFDVVPFEVYGDDDIAALEASLLKYPDKQNTSVKLALKGALTIRQRAELEATLDRVGDLFARLEHWERHFDVAVMPESGDFSGLGLTGFARDALKELEDRASMEAQSGSAGPASGALSLLYRLAGGLA